MNAAFSIDPLVVTPILLFVAWLIRRSWPR